MITDFFRNKLVEVFSVDAIITCHYFEYTKDFYFIGEQHDFWELVYVDSGSVSVTADSAGHVLEKGDVIFHKPNEYHNIRSNGVYSNVIVLTFVCRSPEMDFFMDKIIKTNERTGKLFADIIKLQKATFEEPLNIVEQTKMTLRQDAPIGNLQLIKISIERLLIHLRQTGIVHEAAEPSAYAQVLEESGNPASVIIAYMVENLKDNITLEVLSEKTAFSKSYIKKTFKALTGMTVIECLTTIRIDRARYLISLRQHTFSEIAEMSGFTSIHYFSRIFKKYTGMTPSEYAKTVKAQSLL